MTSRTKSIILRIIAVLLCVLPPLAVTLAYFPLWVERSTAATLSGSALVLMLLCLVPLMRQISKGIKTPAMWMIWLFLFLLFFALKAIVDELEVITFVGFVSNSIGAVLYKWGELMHKKDVRKNE